MKIRCTPLLLAMALCVVSFSCKNESAKKINNSDTLSHDQPGELQLRNNKALVLKLYQALNDTNWTVAKSLVDQDFKHHFVKDSGFGFTNWVGFEKGYRMSHNAFPDWKLTPLNVVAEGDYVSVLLTGQGTHRGEFAGIPATNLKAGAPIMLMHQIKDNKIIADWEIMNTSSFLEQIKK